MPTASITATVLISDTGEIDPAGGITTSIGQSGFFTITLGSAPTLLTPGETISIDWRLRNAPDPLNLSLDLITPNGFSPVAYTGAYSETTHTLTLPITMTVGSALFVTEPGIEGPYTFQANLYGNGRLLASRSRTIDEAGLGTIGSDGGQVVGLSRSITVTFPTHALAEAAQVRVRHPKPAAQPPTQLLGQTFEILARSQSTGAAIHRFQQPITITVSYDPSRYAGFDESALGLYYYDPDLATWVPSLSRVITQTHQIIAWSNHLSFWATNVQNWQMAHPPTLDNFQVSSFSGAATYSSPIWAPPGPGGLQPSLSLSYNSQAVDSATGQTQAGWVGMGWTLETGYIERNMMGTDDYLDDDTFVMMAGGVSSMLLPGSDGYYHTADESFWRIQYNSVNDSWTAWDKTGTQYIFGSDGYKATYAYFREIPGGCDYDGGKAWRWPLTRVRNIFGKELTYQYTKETKGVDFTDCTGQHHNTTDIAIYPSSIIYPNNKYKIDFLLTQDRSDYDTAWLSPTSRIFFQKSRLSEIDIKNDANGDGVPEQVIRKYVLTYDPTNPIFPGYAWSAGGKTPALKQVQEFGLNNASLPAATFAYGDGMHLTQANNGYGGRVDFSYDSWYDLDTHTGKSINQQFGFAGYPCYNTLETGGWSSRGTGSVYCDSNTKHLMVVGDAIFTLPTYLLQPGAYYQVYAQAGAGFVGYAWMVIGASDGSTDQWTAGDTVSYWAGLKTQTGTFQMARSAGQVSALIRCSNPSVPNGPCEFWQYTVKLLPLRYRVTQKAVTDQVTGQVSTWYYEYDEPASNDGVHSAAATGSNPYLPPYAESRGHAMVRELDPDWKVTQTYYHQDDARKGSAHTTLVGTNSSWDPFNSLNASAWTYSNINVQQSVERQNGDMALKNSASNVWGTVTRPADGLHDGDTVLAQFYIGGDSSTQAVLDLESYTNSNLRWAIFAHAGYIEAQYNNGSGWVYPKVLISTLNFKYNHWYVAQLSVDDNAFMLRVWDRDDPSKAGAFECINDGAHGNCTMPSGLSWHFKEWVLYGTLYTDSYSEGKLYTNTVSSFAVASSSQPSPMPTAKTSGSPYTGLSIVWTRPDWDETLIFNGDGEWLARTGRYQYDGYGNKTRTLESKWDSTYDNYNGGWQDYRLTLTGFYPNTTNGVYIVGLPAYSQLFKCPDGLYNFACSSTDPQYLLSQVLSLYDSHTNYYDLPTSGVLTGKRTLIRFAGANYTDQRYADETYGYDAWGNRARETKYLGENVLSGYGAGAAQTTYTCYGVANQPAGCTDDPYYTYPAWQKDALGNTIQWAYNKAYTQPTSETDSNNITTLAEYDDFGRLTKIIKPGDSSGSPTFSVSYHDSPSPMWVELQQKIDGVTANQTVRKYYNGWGQVIQEQTIQARLGSLDRDVIVDIIYDAAGRVYQQSVPYDVATGSGYRTPLAKPYTETTYDVLGRTLVVRSPDNTRQTYTYPETSRNSPGNEETCLKDARNNQTCTITDVWGRTGQVNPPTGPAVGYVYDAADRLIQVNRGLYPTYTFTYITYDLAGRKLSLNDPDLGIWSYSYDALGNMTRQTDARGCQTTLDYDSLNRLTWKVYTGAACNSTHPVQNLYDLAILRQDNFEGNDLPDGWVKTSTTAISVSDGQAHIVAQNDWNTYIYRAGTLSDGQGMQISFRLDSVWAGERDIYLRSGAYGSPEYRSWGLTFSAGTIYRDYVVGSSLNRVAVGSVAANVWYDMRLVVDGNSQFRAEIWERDNPTQRVTLAEAHSESAGKAWFAMVVPTSGTVDVESYQEFALSGKIGPRAGMTDSSGSTAWSYDERGRMTQETKTVSEGGTFVTQWGYNSADGIAWMKYPGGNSGETGEQVTSSYLSQNTLNGVSGDSSYVQSTAYDAAGRVTSRNLGNVLTQSYTYFDWDAPNGQGRLQRLTAGALQDLSYTYDEVGDVLTIQDAKAGGTQTQTFGYDPLNRLMAASASGGSGGTYGSETYEYEPSTTGNLSSKAGVSYTYNNSSHSHAVRSTSSGGSYDYDANGNLLVRSIGATQQRLDYDSENRLTQVRSFKSTNICSGQTTPGATNWQVYDAYTIYLNVDTSTCGFASTPLYFTTLGGDGSHWVTRGTNAIYAATPTGFTVYIWDPYGITPAVAGQYRWYINWQAVPSDQRTPELCSGQTPAGSTNWQAVDASTISITIDTSACGFSGVPEYLTSMSGNNHALTRGISSVYAATATGFTIYIWSPYGITPAQANQYGWQLNWQARPSGQNTTELCTGRTTAGATNWQVYNSTMVYVDVDTSTCGLPNSFLYFTSLGGNSYHYLAVGVTAIYLPTTSGFRVYVNLQEYGITPAQANQYQWHVNWVATKGQQVASYGYDGDGQRVKAVSGATTTTYIGNYLEWTGSTSTMVKYYYAGSARVAERQGSALSFLLADHLGSTAITADSSGSKIAELRYKPWGETRYSSGTTPTNRRFTGQTQDSYINLYWMGSRWYDPALGRWIQPDSIVPEAVQGVQAWDRFAYSNNNPVRFTDPSGHCILLCSAIGAVAGAVVGGGIYAATTQISGREWNTNDFLVSMGTGAVGGALIGTGVGAAAGIATFAAIGAGSGVIAGELGYSATAGDNFDSGDMAIASAASGIAGGVTGGVGASSIAGSGTAFAVNMLANGGASAAQYTATQISNGQPVNPASVLENGLIGAVIGGIDDTFIGGSQYAEYANRWMSVANNPATRSSLSNASRMAIGGLVVDAPGQAFRSGFTNYTSSYWQKKMEEAK